MSSGGGKVQQVNYDSTAKDAEFSSLRNKVKTETDLKAYEAALNAENYKKVAVQGLNEGLGFLSKYMDTQKAKTRHELSMSEKTLNEDIPDMRTKGQAGAMFLTSQLEDYIKEANQNGVEFLR